MLLSLTEARGRAARFDPVGFVSEPDTKRLRIAASARNVFQDRPHKEVRNAVEDTADLCEDLGHEVDDAIIELDGEEFIDHFLVVWAAGPAQLVADYRKRYGKLPDDSVYESWTLGLAEHFASKPSDALENALSYFKSVARQVELFFDNYDVALSPTLFTPPPPLGEQGPVAPFGDLYDRVVKYVSYTPVHNVAGTPAMSVPLHWTKEGLPVGSQFAARQGNEAMLLKLAYELEEAKPWANKWPFICAHTMFSQV